MGTVIQLKKQINNSYFDLKNSVEEKLILVEEKINNKLNSEVYLVQKISDYHIKTGGKRLRALLTLESSKLCGYLKGGRDINLAACVELIHGATLLHDDVIDNDSIRRRKKTPNFIWGNHSSILAGDYLLSRCFEMMVEDGNLEILKLLSSTSAKIAQGEILQLQHKKEIDMLEETYLKIISSKTAALFSAATKVGAILAERNNKDKEALEFYGNNLGLTFQIADDTLDYKSEINIFGKKTGNDFYEGKITLPIILLFQQSNDFEKKELINFFKKNIRTKEEFSIVLKLISKYKIISQCYKKAQHFINLARSSLSIFKESKEKKILENLTSFSIERSF
ncbi:MAG TPA: polyprenyl synthetase family protein [Candidatus Pelagibacter bacterium]|jgi:octaprenyl-diphosphate synthase|nr:octaprenyl-diphosphate synthase [Pelagibacteraceae bacterium]HJN84254.1 polyprenyl synthetase family protein [Candidatus Pelagibacter bacterium]|tara:strand:+ start:4536 stop:5549 length:1014 start_codon:yes stop_codon:yes gene_type:complete